MLPQFFPLPTTRKLAEKYIGHARNLLSSHELTDVYSALTLLDAALKISPQLDNALELKARTLLCLRRFKDIAHMFHEFIPSFCKAQQDSVPDSQSEKLKLLADPSHSSEIPSRSFSKRKGFFQCFPFFRARSRLWGGIAKKLDKEQWKCLVLGQACCHLGMMEDAMVLLSHGKRAAYSALRKRSSCLREDGFHPKGFFSADSDTINHLLGNIKILLRRRTVAIAAFDAGCYAESVKHLSKILEGKRGTPQGFVAECYLHRAKAYLADGRVADAIADCNRTLTLNPTCVEAFSIRATIFEMIGCLPECAGDLAQLRAIYASLLRNPVELQWASSQNSADEDLQESFNFVTSKLETIKEKLGRIRDVDVIDYHMVLGMSRGCSRADVERSYMLLSLRHRPDRAANFVDRCELVDEREVESVKEEARALAFHLFYLIQRAYTGIMSVIVGEEMERAMRNGIYEPRPGDLRQAT